MSPGPVQVQRIVELAQRVEADIQSRKLKPGDRYLGTGDTAKMLRVDTAVANRALQLLVKRNVLTRRQRAGTFVAEGAGGDCQGNPISLSRVHLLMNDRYIKTEGLFGTEMMLGLQSELPGAQVQFHVVPSVDEADYLRQMIGEALGRQYAEGFILVSSTLVTQRLLAASGLPAVVFGHVYASVEGLPFVDRDQRQVGRLLAEYVLRQGHRRIVVLTRQRLLPGDDVAIDAIRDVMSAAELPASALVLRCLPHDRQEVRSEVKRLLEASDGLPGVLARPALMAEAAIEAIELLGLRPQRDVAVVAADYYRTETEVPPYPIIRPTLSFQQQGEQLGRLLVELADGEPADHKRILSPVELQLPEDRE